MNAYHFITKADTLNFIDGKLSSCAVKAQVSFTVSAWKKNAEALVEQVSNALKDEYLIVRSSAITEDSAQGSNAGFYVTVTHVPQGNAKALAQAINEVIASYGSDGHDDANKVLVQGEICPIAMIGVAFTCDLTNLAPYDIINYEDIQGRCDSVTGGGSKNLKTYVRFHRSPHPIGQPRLVRVIMVLRQLEEVLGHHRIDVEFAFDKTDTLYILQVRPVAQGNKLPLIDAHTLEECLLKIHKKVIKLNNPHPYLYGHKTILGVMPDWNPAEILGSRPRMLAVSLYRELVTDAIWAYQRSNYGYKNVRSFPLLRVLMGLPYIDVRVSFNSFLPKGLSDALSHKLVDHYLAQLSRFPKNHDKVEFEIVFSCYDLDLDDRIQGLKGHGFSDAEISSIKSNLLGLTNDILHPTNGFYRQDLARIEELKERQQAVLTSQLPIIDKIYWLLEDCKRYGTLPFAGLARCAFIARQFARSLVKLAIISEDDLQAFMASLDTVTKRFSDACHQLQQGTKTQEDFLKQYGHLRPGTYDILSMRYDEAFEQYFTGVSGKASAHEGVKSFSFSAAQMSRIDAALKSQGLCINATELIEFMSMATIGREYAKFVFTRSVSDCLVLLEQLGAQFGITREELSFLNIRTVLDLYSLLDNTDLPKLLRDDINRNKDAYRISAALKMPHLIVEGHEVYDFFMGEVDPNFVSLQRVMGATVCEEEFNTKDITGKVVFVPSADPGYDWLFSKNILGLITMYGGANSHMAVRAAELGLPAVIGAGEQNYTYWSTAAFLDVDCANKQVTVIR